MKLNPKYTTLIGAILAVLGFAYIRMIGPDIIVTFFAFFLGIILFLLGVAGLLGNWYHNRKKN
jgi:hypothetical protein